MKSQDGIYTESEALEKFVSSKNLIIKSKLPDTDYVINPYLGCRHACKYCYAEFMSRFYNISEPWGSFVKQKDWSEDLEKTIRKIDGKVVLFGSVTDVYQPIEGKNKLMRKLLPLFENSKCQLEILTKSPLVLRDLDILKRLKNVTVGISLSTLDEKLIKETEVTSTPENRLKALTTLKEEGINNYLFISPIFPKLSLTKKLIQEASKVTDTILFENLNLRGKNRSRILDLIKKKYPKHYDLYHSIYIDKDISYWDELEIAIKRECKEVGIKSKIYFHHYSAPNNYKTGQTTK